MLRASSPSALDVAAFALGVSVNLQLESSIATPRGIPPVSSHIVPSFFSFADPQLDSPAPWLLSARLPSICDDLLASSPQLEALLVRSGWPSPVD